MSAPAIRYRPIFGGIFGKAGRYSLATMPCTSRGLHAVRFMVLDARAGAVLSVAETKLDALADARRLLLAASALARKTAANEDQWQQSLLWPDEVVPIKAGKGELSVPRRRREVFDRCEGRCHYCHTTLTLDGKWHVEHMLPKALGGTDDACNLVSACVPCNLAKRDTTAIEFVTGRMVK